jgi:hypothetical protein
MGGALCKRLGIHHVERKEREEPTAGSRCEEQEPARAGVGRAGEAHDSCLLSYSVILSFSSTLFDPLSYQTKPPSWLQLCSRLACLLADVRSTRGTRRVRSPGRIQEFSIQF